MSKGQTGSDAKGWERGEKGFAKSKDNSMWTKPERGGANLKKQFGDWGQQIGLADDKDFSR